MDLANDANITALFEDIATRHPLIKHVPNDPDKKRFFEQEWDEMMQNGDQLNIPEGAWYLILEDYREEFKDNNADYIRQEPVLSWWVITHVPLGDLAAKKAAFEGARAIAKGVWSKLSKDAQDHLRSCEADVPEGVQPLADVFLGTLVVDRLQHPMFTHAFGVRCMIKVLTNHEENLVDDSTAWIPLS